MGAGSRTAPRTGGQDPSLAARQGQLTVTRERIVYAAAHGHFTLTAGGVETTPAAAARMPAGTAFRVAYRDERAAGRFGKALEPLLGDLEGLPWQERRPFGEAEFSLWDPASVAYELYVNATGRVDPERKYFLGGWSYMTAEEDLFWSMAVYYHATEGKHCLPPNPPQHQDKDATVVGRAFLEHVELMKSVAESTTGAPPTLQCQLQSVCAMVTDIMNRPQADAPGTIPMFDSYGTGRLSRPLWWREADGLWTKALKRYVESGRPPCMWAHKPTGCCVGEDACPNEHAAWAAGLDAAKKSLAQPVAVQEALGVDSKLMSSWLVCGRAGCTQVGQEEDFQRCALCRNAVYCSAGCQKAAWEAHKGFCRGGAEEGKGRGSDVSQVWAVVLPGDRDRKPYALLLPSLMGAAKAAIKAHLGLDESAKLAARRPQRPALPPESELVKDLLVYSRTAATTAGQPPNPRASCVVSVPQYNLGNPVAIDGPDVAVRGDAVVVRPPPGQRINVPNTEQLRDFTFNDFTTSWGLFNYVQHPGDKNVAFTTLMELNAENEKNLANVMGMM